MALTEDLGFFLDDFGLPCVAGAVSFVGLLDQPDEILNLQRADAFSRQYELTYVTALVTPAVTLSRGSSLTVNGLAYTVREAPRQIGDGVFSSVVLTKN